MVFVRKRCGTGQLLAPSAERQNSWRQRYRPFTSSANVSDIRQILLDKKYGRAVDWWAFGVLIYQMLLQQSPFRGEDEDEIYDAILADEPLYPIHMPRDSVSILQKLLTREPELRLGSGPTDAQEIMSHAFFRTINWDDVKDKKIAPPFLPSIASATDTSNFDSEFTSVTPVLTPVQSGKLIYSLLDAPEMSIIANKLL
jgi:serine/threonine protein kinase